VSALYLAQPGDHQQLEWLDGGTLTMLLDSAATDGQLMMGRFSVARGEAPPFHKHLHEDEIFMLISGTALVWFDDAEYELAEGGVAFLPRNVAHGYRITSEHADLLMINTPGGIEGMFRETGRDMSTPRPEGFEVRPDAAAAERHGNIVLGPPR
jgi:quercetin dioxygenase-like cupin family protein